MHRGDALFAKIGLHNAMDNQIARAIHAAENSRPEQSNINSLIEKLTAEYSVTVPTILPDRIETEIEEVPITYNDGYGRRDRTAPNGTRINVYLPFEGDEDIFKCSPSRRPIPPLPARIEGKYVVFSIVGTNLTKEEVQAEIQSQVTAIAETLEQARKDSEHFSSRLRDAITQALNRRQQKLSSDSELISGLGYKQRNR